MQGHHGFQGPNTVCGPHGDSKMRAPNLYPVTPLSLVSRSPAREAGPRGASRNATTFGGLTARQEDPVDRQGPCRFRTPGSYISRQARAPSRLQMRSSGLRGRVGPARAPADGGTNPSRGTVSRPVSTHSKGSHGPTSSAQGSWRGAPRRQGRQTTETTLAASTLG